MRLKFLKLLHWMLNKSINKVKNRSTNISDFSKNQSFEKHQILRIVNLRLYDLLHFHQLRYEDAKRGFNKQVPFSRGMLWKISCRGDSMEREVESKGYVLLFRSQYSLLRQNGTIASRPIMEQTRDRIEAREAKEDTVSSRKRENRRESIICKTACR